MIQSQLNQLVADVTLEEISVIQKHGFSLADPFEVDFDPEPNDFPMQEIDWDNLALNQNVAEAELI